MCFVLNRDAQSVALFGIGTRMERVRFAERWLGRIFVLEYRGVALFFTQRFLEFFLMCFVLNRDTLSVALFWLERGWNGFVLRRAGRDGFLYWNLGALHFFFTQRFSEFFLMCFVLNRDALSVALFGIGTRMERVRFAERWL